MSKSKNSVHPISSEISIESHLLKDIIIRKEDIHGVDNTFAFFLAFISFFCFLTIDGTSYTTGLIVEVFQQRFEISSLPLILLPGSLVAGTYHIIAPFAGAFFSNKDRLRLRAGFGAALALFAAISCIFITNYYAFMVAFGLLMGLGFGLIFIPCIAITSSWFVKYKSYGIGLAHSGTGFGIFLFSQFIPHVPESFRMEGHFIGITGLCLLCLCSVVFFIKPEKYLEKTFREKEAEMRREILSKLNIEEQIRLDNVIFKQTREEKMRQRKASSCNFDGMIITNDNNLIHVSDSLSQLYDQPRLTKLQIDQITKIVMAKMKDNQEELKDNTNNNENETNQVEEIVRDYINSKFILNNQSISSSIPGLEDGENDSDLQDLGSIKCSVNMELDKILKNTSINNNNLYSSQETIEKTDFFKSQSIVSSDLSTGNVNLEPKFDSEEVIDRPTFQLKLWKSPTFILIIFSSMIAGLELLTPYSFIPLFLRENNFNNSDTSSAISLMGLSNIVGRILAEVYVQMLSGKISYDDCLWFHNISLAIASLSIVAIPFLVNWYGVFMSCCCINSMAMVFSNSIKISLVLDYLGLEFLTGSYTFILLFQGLFMVAGPPLHGLLFELTDRNFIIVFSTMGGLLMFSAFCSCLIKLTHYCENCIRDKEVDVEKGVVKAEDPQL